MTLAADTNYTCAIVADHLNLCYASKVRIVQAGCSEVYEYINSCVAYGELATAQHKVFSLLDSYDLEGARQPLNSLILKRIPRPLTRTSGSAAVGASKAAQQYDDAAYGPRKAREYVMGEMLRSNPPASLAGYIFLLAGGGAQAGDDRPLEVTSVSAVIQVRACMQAQDNSGPGRAG